MVKQKVPEMTSVFAQLVRLTGEWSTDMRRLFSAAVGWLSTSDLICSLNPMIIDFLYDCSIAEYGIDAHYCIVSCLFPP